MCPIKQGAEGFARRSIFAALGGCRRVRDWSSALPSLSLLHGRALVDGRLHQVSPKASALTGRWHDLLSRALASQALQR
jgi:hypothetical protein